MDTTYHIGQWRQYAALYWAPGLDFTLEPQRTALVVVDVQRKTCDRHAPRGLGRVLQDRVPELAGAYFDRLEETVVPNIQRLLSFFRQRGLRIVYFTVGPHLPDGQDLPYSFRVQYGHSHEASRTGAIYEKSPEFAIVDAIAPREGDLVFHKVTNGGFTGTGVELILRNLGIQYLLLVGGATHVCVESTGRAASDLGFGVVLVEDGCISQLPLLHDATMINFSTTQGRVLTTQEAVQELERALVVGAGQRKK